MSPRRSGITRRKVLAGAGVGLFGTGVLSTTGDTLAFDSATASRTTKVSVADDQSNAIVGLEVYSPVKKNSRDPLVTVTNNTGTDVTVTVSLNTCSDGTLYDPQGDETDCANGIDSVQYSLASGDAGRVDINANVSGVDVPFTIDVSSPEFSFQASRKTTAESGNAKSAIAIKQIQKFAADAKKDEWSINKVSVKDSDGDDDLDRVEYEITDSSGETRATRTDSASGGKYQANKVTITPDDASYNIPSGENYTLTVTGYDVDGNFDLDTAEDTA